ncbi:glycosyltransferase family 2 protein [Agrobacterium salinitolerans]|uniref:glycosyltransferase family 2 protein n=1 Tax=Agrobacterium salinitolerans TaxID=1183413 RepID=UPI00174E1648
MQILIPIADSPEFFPKSEHYFPKPLVDVAGKPLIERVVASLSRSVSSSKFTFVVSKTLTRQFSLSGTLKLVAGDDTQIIERVSETKGALPSCLLAIDKIVPEEELLVCNSDQIIDYNLDKALEYFRLKGAAAGVLTFESVHPRWSFVQLENLDDVVQAFEKRVVSNVAVAGVYYFRRAADFFGAARRAILTEDSVGGDFYISAAINQIILGSGKVLRHQIDAKQYHPLYSPEKIQEFLATKFAGKLRASDASELGVNVVIPAAGAGSRFAKDGWRKPKPFIDVCGVSMVEQVVSNLNLPRASYKILLQESHITEWPEDIHRLSNPRIDIISVAGLTEGTACTVLLARKHFDNEAPLIIANSDQLVDVDYSSFLKDCYDRGLDGSILVFRDKDLDPKWSFAKVSDDGLVVEVAEKKAISDLATVGIYLFRRGSDFVRAAVDMIANNDRVNNEFYTCPVYNYLIKDGAKIGVYEVRRDNMYGLGTPSDLSKYLRDVHAAPSSDRPDRALR